MGLGAQVVPIGSLSQQHLGMLLQISIQRCLQMLVDDDDYCYCDDDDDDDDNDDGLLFVAKSWNQRCDSSCRVAKISCSVRKSILMLAASCS